jgi:hypothetical protein
VLKKADQMPFSGLTVWVPACAGTTVTFGKHSVIPAQAGIQNREVDTANLICFLSSYLPLFCAAVPPA